MKLSAALLLVFIAAPDPEAADSRVHPRIWLTPATLSALRAKARSGDADWLRVKAEADRLLTRTMPRFTITAATNSNPVRFTLAEPVPWSGSTLLFIGGATGRWAPLNASGDRPSAIAATRVGPNSFTVPHDSRAFGSFSGQRLVLFFGEDDYSGYGYAGLGWQSMLEVLGVAYQVTGKAVYASKGIELVDYIASLGDAGMLAPVAIDSGFPTRSAVYALAIGYDWLHDRLSAKQRAAAVRAINLWFDWFRRGAFENNGPAYGNYFGGHVMGFGLAGLATEADNPRGPEIVGHVRTLFDKHIVPAFATGGFAGGYPVEGYPYGSNHFERLLSYMLAVETATGADVIIKSGYPQKIARNLLYNLKPNNWQVSDEANCAGDHTGILPASLPIMLSSLLAGTDEGRWMQHLYQNLARSPNGGQAASSFVRFLFYDRTRPAADYRLTQPTWFRSPGDDHFYRRSSWQGDAVWMSMAGGAKHWAGHQMRAAGHIAIQRGNDYLLVNSGQWKGTAGDFGVPYAFDLRSWRGNTLFVDDFGDYLFTGADYLGGQGYWGVSSILAQEGGHDFGYIKTDLTTAYSVGDYKPWASRSVRHFYRSFLSMGTGVVVVFDRIRLLKAHYAKKLYFHLNPAGGRPAIAGNTVSMRVGSSALFIRTLMPASPVLTVAPDPVSDEDSRAITYRVEMTDSVANAALSALNVLVATSSTTDAMPPTVLLQSTNGTMVGAMVMEDRVARIGLFSSDGTPQSTTGYTADYGPGQTGLHVLADLVPDARCVLARNGMSLGDAAVSKDGVLTFRSSAGGNFLVRCRPARQSGASRPPG